MPETTVKIGVVAPAGRIEPALADKVTALARRRFPQLEIRFHPQCFASSGHFAGDDALRAEALVQAANDPGLDAVWFARGGYGCCRLAEMVLPRLEDAARAKTYLGYSDIGFLLAALYRAGFPGVVHGPMPSDLKRRGGEVAVSRALAFLGGSPEDTVEPAALGELPVAAFNLTTLSHLIGTPLEPDLSGHILMLEDVAEHMYRIDRALFHVTSTPAMRRIAGLRLGRFSEIPPNNPEFGRNEEEVAMEWCARSGIAYLGRADIGHDTANKVVPFGRRR